MATNQAPYHRRIWTLKKDDVSYELHICVPEFRPNILRTYNFQILVSTAVLIPVRSETEHKLAWFAFPLVLRVHQTSQPPQPHQETLSPKPLYLTNSETAKSCTTKLLRDTPLATSHQPIDEIAQKLLDITSKLTTAGQGDGSWYDKLTNVENQFPDIARAASV